MGKKLLLSGFALGILLFGVGLVGIFTSDKLIQGIVKSVERFSFFLHLKQNLEESDFYIYKGC